MLSIKTLTHLLLGMAMLCNATYTGLMASKARLTTARWSLTAALTCGRLLVVAACHAHKHGQVQCCNVQMDGGKGMSMCSF